MQEASTRALYLIRETWLVSLVCVCVCACVCVRVRARVFDVPLPDSRDLARSAAVVGAVMLAAASLTFLLSIMRLPP